MKVGDQQLTDLFSVTSGYGMRNHPTKGGQRMHHGIDYGTPTGTEVTISGGQFLGTFDDKGGGGITSQYSITDADGNPFEILLMHGSNQNKITMDGANTSGQPIGGSQDPARILNQLLLLVKLRNEHRTTPICLSLNSMLPTMQCGMTPLKHL